MVHVTWIHMEFAKIPFHWNNRDLTWSIITKRTRYSWWILVNNEKLHDHPSSQDRLAFHTPPQPFTLCQNNPALLHPIRRKKKLINNDSWWLSPTWLTVLRRRQLPHVVINMRPEDTSFYIPTGVASGRIRMYKHFNLLPRPSLHADSSIYITWLPCQRWSLFYQSGKKSRAIWPRDAIHHHAPSGDILANDLSTSMAARSVLIWPWRFPKWGMNNRGPDRRYGTHIIILMEANLCRGYATEKRDRQILESVNCSQYI